MKGKKEESVNHIGILLPSNYGSFQQEFFLSVFEMQQFFYEWCIQEKRDDQLSVLIHGGYELSEMRNNLVERALELGVTHLLFLDTDMSFPKQMIVTMLRDLEGNKGVEAITGLYTRKSPPYLPHVYPKYNKRGKKFNMCGQFPMNELFKVEGAGCGCLMTKREVFERVEKPWFSFDNNDDARVGKSKTKIPINIGEDLYFCLKAKPLILCDTRLVCKHYKMNGFDISDYIEYNGLKKVKGGFKATQKQILQIADKYAESLKK